jgi:hypothetical protein
MSGKETRDQNLFRATEDLTKKVAILTGVVETNNNTIIRLRKELNQKPDDSEILFITGMAKQQRRRHLEFAVTTSVVSAVLAGAVAFAVADHNSHIRCLENSKQSTALVKLLSRYDVSKKNEIIQDAIEELNKSKVEC